MIGAVAPIAQSMPYYAQTLLAIVKTHVTILFLGIPAQERKNSEQQEEANLEQQEEANSEQQQDKPLINERAHSLGRPPEVELSIRDIITREAAGVLLLGMYALTLTIDVRYVYKAFMLDAPLTTRFSEAVNALAISPNFTSMMCGIGLFGLYAARQEGAIPGSQVIAGEEWRVAAFFWQFTETASWLQYLPATLPWLTCLILQLAVGGILMPLEEETLRLLPARSQRILIRALFYTYKPFYHLLMITILPGLFAYIWVTLPLLMFLAMSAVASFKVLLPRSLRIRRWTTGGDDSNPEDTWPWQVYMAAPIFANLLPVMIPLTTRLLEGKDYMGALWATWEERHAVVYFTALMNKFQTAGNTTDAGIELCYELWAHLVATAI